MSQIDFKKVKARISKIRIKGLAKTKDEYVRAHFEDVFEKTTNFEELLNETDSLKKRLLSIGCFKTVEVLIDSSKDKQANSFDVLLNVEEYSSISGGIHTSIGNNEGSMNTTVGFPNVFGKGERISGEYSQGTNNHTDYRINFNSPINMNPRNVFSMSAFRSSNDFSWSKYKQNDTGVSVDLLFPFKRVFLNRFEVKGSHALSYEGIWRHMLSSLDSSFHVREQSGHSLKSSIRYTNSIDRRDNKILPNQGGFLKNTVEFAGLGGDVRFFKADSDYQYTRTFFDYFTTQFSFSGGFVLPLKKEEKISICDKYFLGGPLNLRGFSNRGAGENVEDCSLGNDAYWLFAAHLYTPLPFLHNHKTLCSWFKTHSFVNVGNLLSIDQLVGPNGNENRAKRLVNNCRLSVGTGLVIAFGNIARVELNYVWPIWKNQTDKYINGLQFGIGVNFN